MKLFQYIIISSPSGAGKTTLSKMLLADKNLGTYHFSVSHTTRSPRADEVYGKDYYFVSKSDFSKMIEAGEFAEYAKVHGNYYGTSMKEIRRLEQKGGDGIIFDIDYQGANQIKNKLPNTLAIFILPPSIAELRKRLIKRGTEKTKNLEKRFTNAVKEIKHFHIFDFVIVNDILPETYERLKKIICAHRYSVHFAKDIINNLIEEWKTKKWKVI